MSDHPPTIPPSRSEVRAAGLGARDFLGHPRGLAVLFATESWERFSYFGNAALVVLYMVKYLLEPGRVETVLGFGAVKAALEFLFGRLDPQPLASQIFGFYTGLAYFMPVLGGLIADRLLGQRRTVVIGGVLMAIGHFMMAFETLFLGALFMLILGIGAFKPNISTQVGSLYPPGDDRRDRAYSIFYLGINIGAFLAPLVCGTLAVQYGWHAGFGAAGIGMLVGLGIYLSGQRTLPPDALPKARTLAAETKPLGPGERRAVLTLIVVCALVTMFWAAYDQQGNTLVLWAEDFTDRSIDLLIWRGEVPSTWFLALNPLMIFIFTPLIVRLWARQGRQGTELSAISKMAYFAIATIGELHLAPVGLALVSKMAPARILSMMMGFWFAATLPGDILAGFLGGFWSTMAKSDFFLMIASIAALGSATIWATSHVAGNQQATALDRT
jgi:POT family proton-dependent oligopeptide transporter